MPQERHQKEETIWRFKVDLTDSQRKCTRQSVQIAKKNVMFLSSPEVIVQFIVEIAIRSAKIAAVKNGKFYSKQD